MRSDTDKLALRIAIGAIIGAVILVCLGVITVQQDGRRGQVVARLGEGGGEPGGAAEERALSPEPEAAPRPVGERVEELPGTVAEGGQGGLAAGASGQAMGGHVEEVPPDAAEAAGVLGPGTAADTESAMGAGGSWQPERPPREAGAVGLPDAGYRPAAVRADSGLEAGADTPHRAGAVGAPVEPPEQADTAGEAETPDAVPATTAVVEPGSALATGPARPTWSRDENGLPPLARADLAGSVVADGQFEDPHAWAPLHRTEVEDSVDIKGGENYILWERTRSMDDPGTLGVYQDLQVDVSPATSLAMSLDVLIDRDSVDATRARLVGLETAGLAPVRVRVTYQGVDRRWYHWEHAFLGGRYDPLVFDLDEETGALSLKEGATLTEPVTVMAPGRWCRFEFDLMDDAARRDPATGVVYPRPAWVARISLYGTGWDFRGAAGNVALRPG
jgi:hypothetical protein